MKVKKSSFYVTTFILFLLCSFLLSSCQKKIKKGTYTLGIYMCGSNLESKRGAASSNIEELLRANIRSDINIIIQTGGSKKWRTPGIDEKSISRYRINNKNLDLLEKKEQDNMGSSTCLEDFLKFLGKNYPSDKMSLILWDHGSGSAGTFCMDENYGMDGLSALELDQALNKGLGSKKLDFIGYDLCLAANFETMMLSSKYASNMIASQEIEPLGGWDYYTLASNLLDNNFYNLLLESFAAKCKNNNQMLYTLSHINLDNVSTFVSSFNDFITKLKKVSDNSLKTISLAAHNSMCFGLNTAQEGYSDLIDLKDFADKFNSLALVKELEARINKRNSIYKEKASGLSLYYPLSGTEKLNDYLINLKNETYKNFLETNYLKAQDKNLIKFIDRGSNQNGELRVKIEEDSLRYVSYVEYKVYQYYTRSDGYSRWISFGSDTDIIDDGKGSYQSSCKGKWVRFGDVFVCCYPIDKNGNISLFSAPCKKNGIEGMIRFTYDSLNHEFKTLGFIEKTTDKTAPRMQTIKKDDKIQVLFYEVLDNGKINLCEGSFLPNITTNNFNVETAPNGMYKLQIIITDIFGNKYYSLLALTKLTDGRQEILEIN